MIAWLFCLLSLFGFHLSPVNTPVPHIAPISAPAGPTFHCEAIGC